MKQWITLTSRSNERVKEAAALLSAAGRRKSGRFLIEGARLCEDASLNGAQIEAVFVTPRAQEKYKKECAAVAARAGAGYLINEEIAQKLSDTGSSQEIFCVCVKTERWDLKDVVPDGIYLFCDDLQNPDNLGAVVRSAEALGARGLILSGGCDRYSPKALRASMGALLRFPVYKTEDGVQTLAALRQRGFRVYATMLTDDAEDIKSVDKSGGVILVVGNEGSGVSDAVAAQCTQKIIIPMKGKAQSLNAAAAAAIALWEFVR